MAGGAIRKLLWHPPSASLFVVLDHHKVGQARPEASELADLEQGLRDEVRKLEADGGNDFVRHVRIGFHAPRLPTTPIDNRSADGRLRMLAGFGKGAIVTSLAAGLGFGAAAARAEDTFSPAVSDLNGELGIMGGLHNGGGALVVEGAVSVPLGDQFGTRWDAMVATINGTAVGGVAGHLFWRDPDVALIGIAGGVLASNAPLVAGANQVAVFAVEAEAYLDDLTLSGLAGFQVTGTPASDGVVARLDLEWYATEDLMFSAGVETNPQVNALGRLGVEYRPAFEALPGLSVFAEGAVGSQGYHRVLGGIRFYFGESETLQAKHRRDTFRSHLLPTRMIDSLPSSRLAYGN